MDHYNNSMDPNKIGQLDPKLKEAYERVMKTTVTPPVSQSQAPMQSAQTMASSVPPAPISAPPHIPPTPDAVSAEPQPAPSPLPPSPTITGTPAPAESKSSSFSAYKTGTLKAHKAGSVPKVLWIVLAIVFFIAYTLLWTRVLGVSLPFLP